MSDYLDHRVWQIHSMGANASSVQTADTKTAVPTEVAQLYVLQDIRDLLSRLLDRLEPPK